MKQTKRLTYEQKKLVSKAGYGPKECRFVEEDEQAILVETKNKERIWISK